MKKLPLFFILTVIFLFGCSKYKDKQTTLRFSMWDKVDPNTTEFIVEFEKQNPDIKLEIVEIPPEDYSQKLNSMLIAGNEPDVILAFEADIERFIKNNVIIKLEDYIAKTKSFSMEDFIPAVTGLNEDNGAVYGLPWCYATELLYYNKDLFDESKTDYPTDNWTWEDFAQAAKKLTKVRDGKVVQWGADAITQPGVWYTLIGAGGDDVVKDGKMSLGEGLKKALDFQYRLTHTDRVSPEPAIGGTVMDLFSSGKAAMTRQGSWLVANYRDVDFNWDIALLPKGERNYSGLHTGFFTITSKSKNKEAAWKFIEFMMSDEGQQYIGKMYSNPSARISLAPKAVYKVSGKKGPYNWDAFDKNAEFADFGYVLINPGITGSLVSQFDSYILKQTTYENIMNEVKKANEQIERFN